MAYKPLIQWYQNQMATDPLLLDLPALVDKALKHFASDQQFYDWAARPAVYATLQNLIAKPRHGATANSNLLKLTSFDRVREHIIDGYKQLMGMTRLEIGQTIAERTKRHRSEGRYLLFLAALRRGLKTDKEKVEDRFTLEQVKTLHTKHMGLKTKHSAQKPTRVAA